MLIFPHVAVVQVQEDINVLVLLMTLSPDDRELYLLFKTTKFMIHIINDEPFL
jgi:hypothetical protein